MPTTSTTKSPPRWKVIHDELMEELKGYDYGSDFLTIAEVCKRFDVSQITAIRVLNELASANLIEKMPGRGNVVRRLGKKVSVRLVIPGQINHPNLQLDSPTQRRLAGLHKAASEFQVDFDIISDTHLPRIFPRRGDVFGFAVTHLVRHETLSFLKEHQLPYVLVDPLEGYDRHPHARVDRFQAGYLATKLLLDQGHRRIALLSGPISQRNFRERLKGYRQALKEAGVAFRWSFIRESDGLSPEKDAQALQSLWHAQRRPTALIAGDDNRALHVLDEARRLEILIPDQLSVVGYPNYPETSLTSPALTVVDAEYERVGARAMRLLLDQMLDGAAPAEQAASMPPRVIERESVVRPPRRRRTQH